MQCQVSRSRFLLLILCLAECGVIVKSDICDKTEMCDKVREIDKSKHLTNLTQMGFWILIPKEIK